VDRVDAVLYTHEHADHIHGIDDLRAISVRRAAPLPVYASATTLDLLRRRFDYIFDDEMRPLPGTSKPEAFAQVIAAGETVRIGDADVTAVAVPHGHSTVFGYRIGDLAYVTDAKRIPDAALERLRGVRVLVLNALFRTQHPTHLSIPEAIEVARELGAERTYLTHLTHDNLHADLEAELPAGIAPAFDGLTVRVD
jgi:phosphoribosyl 1,2-cyclic phosphate phosphodiesterase